VRHGHGLITAVGDAIVGLLQLQLVDQFRETLAAPSATRPSYRTILEAMAAKLPVIAADTPDNRALVTQVNHVQLVVPGDLATLREALEMLAHDRGMRAQLGTANREHVRARFDRAGVIAQYRALYCEVLGPGAIDRPA
ncbi:MAG: glycosyltransferase, partial [Erythrobacter sp.]